MKVDEVIKTLKKIKEELAYTPIYNGVRGAALEVFFDNLNEFFNAFADTRPHIVPYLARIYRLFGTVYVEILFPSISTKYVLKLEVDVPAGLEGRKEVIDRIDGWLKENGFL